MISENEEPDKCHGLEKLWLPEEMRLKYFPQSETKLSYDILPLFEVKDYKNKLMNEISIYSNPEYAERWEKFKVDYRTQPKSKPIKLDSDKIYIFANYRRQKVPFNFYMSSAAPPSPQALFRRTK